MTDKQIIIDGVDVSGCECYSEHREGYCGWHIPCEGDICPYKLKWALQQLKAKEQECEELKDELRKNFEEKKTLHLIIDRLLEASGYDTNTANAEDFEDVYENMRYKQQQLKHKEQECEELKIYIESNEQQVKEVETLVMDNDRLINELDQLKTENEELKKIIKRLDVPKHEVVDMDIALENEKLKEEQAEIKKYLGISHKTILERLEELTEFRDRDRDEIYNSKNNSTNSKQKMKKLKEQLTILDDEAVVVEITVEQFEEYKKLKAENETLFKAIGEVNRINKRLETENEKLKEEKQSLIKDWEEKKNLAYEIACKNEKLKQVLKEIQQTAHESFLQGKMISSGWLCQKIDEGMTQ